MSQARLPKSHAPWLTVALQQQLKPKPKSKLKTGQMKSRRYSLLEPLVVAAIVVENVAVGVALDVFELGLYYLHSSSRR